MLIESSRCWGVRMAPLTEWLIIVLRLVGQWWPMAMKSKLYVQSGRSSGGVRRSRACEERPSYGEGAGFCFNSRGWGGHDGDFLSSLPDSLGFCKNMGCVAV